jgi:hypothetical protein
VAVSIAKLAIMLTTDTSGMQRGFAQAEGKVKTFGSKMSVALIGVSSALAAIGVTAAAIRFGSWLFKITNEAEHARATFMALTGSVRSTAILMQTKEFSKGLLNEQEIVNATGKLLAFGKTADEIPGILQKLGDLSVATGQSIDGLASRFVRSAEAADKLMQAGERAAGALEKANNTISGQLAELRENLEDTFRPGSGAGSAVRDTIKELNFLLTNPNIGKQLFRLPDIVGMPERVKLKAFQIEKDERNRERAMREEGRLHAQMIDEWLKVGNVGMDEVEKKSKEVIRSIRLPGSGLNPGSDYNTSAGAAAVNAAKAQMAQLIAEQKNAVTELKKISSGFAGVASF